MSLCIIYKNDKDGLSIVFPIEDSGLSIEQIAKKDVPPGSPYKIIDKSVIPTDRAFREAWEADFSNPDGYGIGAEAWFAEQETKKK